MEANSEEMVFLQPVKRKIRLINTQLPIQTFLNINSIPKDYKNISINLKFRQYLINPLMAGISIIQKNRKKLFDHIYVRSKASTASQSKR